MTPGYSRRIPHLRCAAALLVAAALTLVAGCSSPAATDKETATVHVEVDIFSGRVNPAFDLEGADAEAVVAVFGDALWQGQPQTPPSVLGFRGLVLTVDSFPDADLIRSIRVVPEGYYIESTTIEPRFVDDPAVYAILLPIVEDYLEDSVYAVLPPPDEG